jgi:hypothetical protein
MGSRTYWNERTPFSKYVTISVDHKGQLRGIFSIGSEKFFDTLSEANEDEHFVHRHGGRAAMTIEEYDEFLNKCRNNESVFAGAFFTLDKEGLPYVVFNDSLLTWEYNTLFDCYGIYHFNGYENAVCLQNTIGM